VKILVRRFVPLVMALCFAPRVSMAQVTITSGPNYCCWSIGQVQHALTASGGNGTYTWSVVGGSLPPGILLRTDVPSYFPSGANAGLIGVATTAGTYNFTLQVTSNGQAVTQSATMHISALTLKDLYEFPDAFVNVTFPTYTLTSLNNTGPVTYTLNNGSLPPGITMSAIGVISGTPSAPGNYSWTVQFTEGIDTEYRTFTINVYAIEITTPGRLPNAAQNAAYNVALSASGGAGGYSFTSGGLPNGLTLTAAGTISGTVTAGPGRWSFPVTATDQQGTSYTKQMAIEVIGGSQFPSIALYGNGNWDDCTIGVGCSLNGQARGGVSPYSWAATGLPPGISIRSGSGVTSSWVIPGDFELWGTPTAVGTYNVQLSVTDATGATTTNILPLKVSSLGIDYSTELPNGTIGSVYSNKFRVLGGSNSYSASVVGGELADGISLNSSSLLVSGTPLENGSFFASFQFADTAAHTLQSTNYYRVGAGASITAIGTDSNLGRWTIGSSPRLYLYACCGSSYVFTLAGGALPPGLSLSSSGVLGGTPTKVGNYSFLIEAADSGNTANVGFKQFTMTVTPIVLTTATTLPYGNVGSAYSVPLSATGGTGTLSWTLAPFNYLPPGLNLISAGSISGTPTLTGDFQFTINTTDIAGNTGTWTLTISIFPTPVTRYVSPVGNDANTGSLSQPYLSIQKCATAVYGGSTCLIETGTYHESVTPNSGIIIMPYNGGSVIVDGTDSVTNWAVYQGSIYQASITMNNDDTNQVFVSQQMMTEARWPNGDDLFHVNWATMGPGTNDSQLIDSNLPNVDWTGAKVHLLSGTDPWSPQSATVTNSSAGKLSMSLDDQDYSPYIQPQAGGFYYIYRSLAALDRQGEWFYDSNKNILYFWAPGDLNPNELNVRVKHRTYGFDLSGRSSVTIEGIQLFGCGINMNSSSANNILDDLSARYVFHFTDFPILSGQSATSYWNDHSTDSGIVLSGSGNILRNSTITWSAGNGVALMGSNNSVINNLIVNTGYAGNYATGINLFGSGHEVQNNTVHTNGRFSLMIYSFPVNPNNNDVSYNNFFNSTLLSLDAGEIYSGNANAEGTHIHHNWLHDTQTPIPFPAGYPRSGMYIDEEANGFEVDQNVLWNNQYYDIFMHGSSAGVTTPMNNYIHNNSVPDVAPNAYTWLQGILNCGTTLVQDNLVFEPVSQTSTNPACMTVDNNSTAPGATDMTAGVQVGCNFAGCASSGPPAISGTMVGPSIVLQPPSATVAAGQSATLSVTARGSPTLTYQWQRNGTNIPSATGASYITPPTTFADNGSVFTVKVSNSVGTVTSDSAVLAIGSSPLLVPTITNVVTVFGGSTSIAPNTSVLIYGMALAPAGDTDTWSGSGTGGVQLDGVSVTMNGEKALVSYISPGQLTVLTPSDLAAGSVQVVVTSGGMVSAPFSSTIKKRSGQITSQ